MAVAEVESMKPIVNEPVKDEKVAMIEEAEKAAGDVGKEVAGKETGKFLVFYAFFSSKACFLTLTEIISFIRMLSLRGVMEGNQYKQNYGIYTP